jgi:putative N6-adenine-specific DNA methylase
MAYHGSVSEGSGDVRWQCAATCTRGLEEVLAGELASLGVERVEAGRGAVRFAGGPDAVVRANLSLRTAMRVLVELAEGPAGAREQLYALAGGVAWEGWVGRGQTIAVTVAGQGRAFANTSFAALIVKDALVDRMRARLGWRPDVDRGDPDVRVWVHLAGDRAAIGVDSSGEPLSHRGYRPRGGPAPLAETLAAGVLLLAGYDGSTPLLDPMCGTGTIAIEAALIANRSAPGLNRRFACERWSWLDAGTAARERDRARAARRPAPAAIVARDIEPRAVAATLANARAAGVAGMVAVARGDARKLAVPAPGCMVVTNPPYGQRVGADDDLATLYHDLGEALRREAGGSTAWLLVGDRELLKAIRLRPAARIVLFNGPIECRLVRYDVRAAWTPEQRPAEMP